MNTRIWIALVAAALVVGSLGGYLLASRRGHEVTEATEKPPAKANQERRVLYWHDPMVPGTKFDKPGKSPFMDMELVPVYADEASDADIRINPAVAQNLGIRLGTVARRTASSSVEAVGNVAIDERLLQVVQARVEGYVSNLYVKAPLERVTRGQRLADVVAPQWLAAQQEYLALLDASSSSAKAIRESARQRLLVLGIPETTIQAIDADRKVQATTTLFSPADGVVTKLSVREGAAFTPSAPLMEVTGLSRVWVNAQVPEAQVSALHEKATIEMRATAWPAMTFTGRLLALLPEVNEQTRTVTARVEVDNPEHKLLPGMFVRLSARSTSETPVLVVPSEAVIAAGERNVVIVSDGSGGFDVAEVQVGSESRGETTILSGLEQGQSIVLSGQFLIDSEANLKSTIHRLTPAEAQP